MEPCQAHRLAIISTEEKLRTVARDLSRYDRLRAAPTSAQLLRKNELLRRRTELEREQRLARARLRDCEKTVRSTA